MPLLRLSLLLLLAALASIATPAASLAQAPWRPTKPVEFVIMAGKGGGADLIVRSLIEIIDKHKLTPVPVAPVNIAGGSGADALVHLKKQNGDDHLLLFTLNSFYTTPLKRPESGIDIAAFAPIGRMAEDAFLLWVHADRTDIKTLDDFVKAARAAGDKWIMAGTGVAQEDSMLTDFLNSTYGLKMTYKAFGGGGEVARELAEKRADSTVNNPAEQNQFFPKDRRSRSPPSPRSAWRCICASPPSARPAWTFSTSCSAPWWEPRA